MKPRGDIITLEIAVVGKGISPKDISIDHLAELLHAATEALSSIAAEAGLPRIMPSLKSVKRGSAVYEFVSAEPTWPTAVDRFYGAVSSRGQHDSPRVRRSLARLFQSARIGALRVAVPGEQRHPPLIMAAPLEPEPLHVEFSRVLYGRAVGVNELERGWSVKIALVDGGRIELDTTEPLAQLAARLFGRFVRAEARFARDGEAETPFQLCDLAAWANEDLIATMDGVRESLRKDQIKVPTKEWLKELDD
jgi:hypothetical protein